MAGLEADEAALSTAAVAPALGSAPFWLLVSADATLKGAVAHPLASYRTLAAATAVAAAAGAGSGTGAVGGAGHIALAFSDPCHLPEHPGWPLRNLLLLAATQWGLRDVQVRAGLFCLG